MCVCTSHVYSALLGISWEWVIHLKNILKSFTLKVSDCDQATTGYLFLILHIFLNIYQKLKSYNIIITNHNLITPATTITLTIIVAKVNNIHKANTFQYHNQNI